MVSLNTTQARKGFFGLVRNVARKHHVYHIRHREGDVVVMSNQEYEALQETLELLSIPGFRQSIARSVKQMKTGQTYSMSQVFGSTD